MGSLYAKDVVETALNEIGYEAEGSNRKYTIYSAELDAVDYFNTKKNGDADWCAIFVIWCMYANTRNADGDIEANKWDAEYFQYQPDRSTAAGVGYMADFYQQNDAWTDNPERGDVVTFRDYAHTGLVVDWDNDGFYTVEGNVDGGKVEKRFYRYGDPCVDGFGRPRYDGWEYEPAPTPEPEPNKENTFSFVANVTVRTTGNIEDVKKVLSNAEIVLTDFNTKE